MQPLTLVDHLFPSLSTTYIKICDVLLYVRSVVRVGGLMMLMSLNLSHSGWCSTPHTLVPRFGIAALRPLCILSIALVTSVATSAT